MLRKPTTGTQKQLTVENEDLRARLGEAEETLRAIRTGEWDALVVSGVDGEQILTLQQSELRYRRLFETTQDGILIVEARTGMITDVNPFLVNLLGYSRKALIGKKFWEVGAFKDGETGRDIFAAMQQDETIRYEDLSLKTKDGRLVRAEFVSTIYLVNDEKVIQCNISDITAGKQAADALRESEVRYRSIFENSQDAILLTTIDGSILDVNLAACQMFGRTEQELKRIGRNGLMDRTDPRLAVALKQRVRTGKMRSEITMLRAGGAKFPVDITSTVFIDAQDRTRASVIIRDITERKQAEQVLSESEKRFRALVENNSAAITMLDATGIAIYDSPAAAGMLGYAPEEWIGRDVFTLVHPDDLPGVQNLFVNLVKTPGARVDSTFRVQHKSGAWLWLEMVTTNLLAEPAVKALVLNYRDVTERMRAAEALQKEKDRAQQYLDIAGVMFLVLDADRKVVQINKEGCEILGYEEQEIIGKDWINFLPMEVRARAGIAFDQIMAGEVERVEYYENPVLTKSGQERLVAWHNSALSDEMGNIIGVVSSGEDITQRNQAEQALAESERHYRQIIETAGEGIWTIDAANRTTLVNQHLADMFGYTVREMIGKSVYDFMDEEGKSITAKSLENRRQGINEQLDFKYKHKDGSAVWAIIETSTLLDHNQQYTGALAMLTNITERKQAQEEIRQRLGELELLYQSGLSFSQLTNPKAIAQKMIDLLDQKMSWHHTAVRLYDPQSETLELLVFNQPNLDSWEARKTAETRFRSIQRPDQGLTGWVVQHGQALRSNDLKNDPRYLETSPGLQSGLYVPIKISERVIGVISIESEQAQAFSDSDERLAITLAAQAAVTIDKALLLSDLKHSNIKLSQAYDATIEGWSGALDLRDKETEGHSQRVTEMTLRLAQSMGMSSEELVQIRRGALLHDIGKMGIPDQILFKPGKLDDDEWKIMRRHPEFAYKLLSPIEYLKPALDIPYCHHEKWDGTGYPRGLKGKEIPLAARLFAVVDVWDALRSDRSYRPAWTEEKVLEHILASSGTHFDPQIVAAFTQILN